MEGETGTGSGHEPVMVEEVLKLLDPGPGQAFLDLTLGAGGHARAILERIGPTGQLVGVDRDEEVLRGTSKRIRERYPNTRFFSTDFARLEELREAVAGQRFDGVLMDLGMSSLQLNDPGRGFSFQLDGPLDMRMDRSGGKTAADLVNRAPEEELIRILQEFGEEHKARRIVRAIVAARKSKRIETTAELAGICVSAVGRGGQKIHPATRTYQALRIAVNDELGALESALRTMPGALKSGGVGVVISFHSLEDRIVKRSFREGARQGVYEVLTSKPLRPTAAEVARNSRARSARLRAVRRTGEGGGRP